MLTIWVHVVSGHLWGCEPLLERVCAVTILIHGDQLLLWGSQRCEGAHHPLHPAGHHLCKGDKNKQGKPLQKTKKITLDTMGAQKGAAEWGKNPDDEDINSNNMRLSIIPGNFTNLLKSDIQRYKTKRESSSQILFSPVETQDCLSCSFLTSCLHKHSLLTEF